MKIALTNWSLPTLTLPALQLTSLTAELLPQAVALDQRIFGHFWSYNGYQQELERPGSDLLALTALNDTTLIPACRDQQTKLRTHQNSDCLIGLGGLWTVLDEAHITVLGVHPDYLHQGLGQALLYGLLSTAHKRGMMRATLEVRASNQAALSLYTKFGFQQAGRRRNYYCNPDEDGLILWKKGIQTPDFEHTLQSWQVDTNRRLTQAGWREWHIHL